MRARPNTDVTKSTERAAGRDMHRVAHLKSRRDEKQAGGQRARFRLSHKTAGDRVIEKEKPARCRR